MRISALEEYGLRCLMALASVGPQGQLSITEVAEKEGISVAYASKLLSILRKTGLVTAVRGRSGGFCISRPPGEISLFEVLTSLGGPLIDPNHCNRFSGQLERCIHTESCSVHYTLNGLATLFRDFLGNTTLEDILHRSITTGTNGQAPGTFTVEPESGGEKTVQKVETQGTIKS